MGWIRTCSTADVTDDRPFGATIGNRYIGIFRSEDRYYALDDVCPHAFALLSDGWVGEGVVECPLHGARFALATGACLPGGLNCDDAARFEVKVDGDDILVLIPEPGEAGG